MWVPWSGPSSCGSATSVGHGQRGAVAEADVHGGVFGEDDLASAREEVPVDGAAASVGAHEDGVGVVLEGGADDDPDELVSGCTSGYWAGSADVVLAAAADQGQTNGCAGGEVAGLGGSRFGAAFGVELHVAGSVGLDALEAGVDGLHGSVGKNDLAKGDAELSVAVEAAGGAHLKDGAAEPGAGGEDEPSLIEQRLGERGIDVAAFLGMLRVERRQQHGVDEASGRGLGANYRKPTYCYR